MASHTYISAITSNSIAVSGPPTTLKALFDSGTFDIKPTPIPVHGPYHAAHLHSWFNAEKILRLKDAQVQRVLGNLTPRFPVMSCTTGAWYTEQTSLSLIQAVLRDILTEPLQFHKVVQGCVLAAQNYRGPRCLVIAFGKISKTYREQTSDRIRPFPSCE